jgi:hypothetical protein
MLNNAPQMFNFFTHTFDDHENHIIQFMVPDLLNAAYANNHRQFTYDGKDYEIRAVNLFQVFTQHNYDIYKFPCRITFKVNLLFLNNKPIPFCEKQGFFELKDELSEYTKTWIYDDNRRILQMLPADLYFDECDLCFITSHQKKIQFVRHMLIDYKNNINITDPSINPCIFINKFCQSSTCRSIYNIPYPLFSQSSYIREISLKDFNMFFMQNKWLYIDTPNNLNRISDFLLSNITCDTQCNPYFNSRFLQFSPDPNHFFSFYLDCHSGIITTFDNKYSTNKNIENITNRLLFAKAMFGWKELKFRNIESESVPGSCAFTAVVSNSLCHYLGNKVTTTNSNILKKQILIMDKIIFSLLFDLMIFLRKELTDDQKTEYINYNIEQKLHYMNCLRILCEEKQLTNSIRPEIKFNNLKLDENVLDFSDYLFDIRLISGFIIYSFEIKYFNHCYCIKNIEYTHQLNDFLLKYTNKYIEIFKNIDERANNIINPTQIHIPNISDNHKNDKNNHIPICCIVSLIFIIIIIIIIHCSE